MWRIDLLQDTPIGMAVLAMVKSCQLAAQAVDSPVHHLLCPFLGKVTRVEHDSEAVM
jgi:hypothetical protein